MATIWENEANDDTLVVQITHWASRLFFCSVPITGLAALMLLLSIVPGVPPLAPMLAADLLLWSLIFVALCAAVGFFSHSATGYLLLAGSMFLGLGIPYVLGAGILPQSPGSMQDITRQVITSFTQASPFPAIIGILMVVKDLVWHIFAALTLTRKSEVVGVCLQAENLFDREEDDRERRQTRYRLLLVPAMSACLLIYLLSAGMVRTLLVQSVRAMESHLSLSPAPPGSRKPQPPVLEANLLSATNSKQRSLSPSLRPSRPSFSRLQTDLTHPTFLLVVQVAVGIMFLSQCLRLLEWITLERGW